MNQPRLPISLIVLFATSTLVGVGLALLVLSGSMSAPAAISPSRAALREGAPAPLFTLKDFAGNPVSLAELRGNVVVINFWASWCPPCLEETPDLVEAYQTLRAQGHAVVFIGVGVNDDSENLRRFAQNNRIPYLVVEDTDNTVSDAYGVLGLPTTVFVDSRGIVRRVWNGAIRKQRVLEIVYELLLRTQQEQRTVKPTQSEFDPRGSSDGDVGAVWRALRQS
ncbi:MAG: TlpA disulfide reductase family protein [Anaerolineae bacterium]|nr:TlpA disulfide reductase family protein [Anaerolineae bacterium]